MLAAQALSILQAPYLLTEPAMRIHLNKLLALVFILLLLLVMLFNIRDLLQDRKNYRQAAEQRVAQGTAGPQSIVGPMLLQNCTQHWTEHDDTGRKRTISQPLRNTLSPASLRINDAEVSVNQLRSGIFPVNTFTLQTRIEADFSASTLRPQGRPGASMTCNAPVLLLAIGDPRGIRHSTIEINGQTLDTAPGTTLAHAPQGVHASLKSFADADDQLPALQVRIGLQLAGTGSLAITPIGKDTQLQLHSNWPHPSFGGAFLPATREVREDGFQAKWQVSHLASSAFSDFNAGSPICHDSSSPNRTTPPSPDVEADTMTAAVVIDGVEVASDGPRKACADTVQIRFVNPVDAYTLADRASKYGILFIVLTFVAVGMFEVLRQLRVHPVQYLLVGTALAMFFLLLIGLSEHYAFGLSYLAAAGGCVLLLGFYASHILRGWKRGLPFATGIALLYGLLYLLLLLQDSALLAGSIALFVVLALIMIATRKVDWYALTLTGAVDSSDSMPPVPPSA